MDTPVLLIIFNRPSTTRQVFEAIRAARPARLFVAADGPRQGRPDDTALCEEARQITTAIDWPCELETLFHSANLGCRRGPATAIDWFFASVEEGIIFEDDVVPTQDFFPFCSQLLERYRSIDDVMLISGTNPAVGRLRFDASYSFSGYPLIWGWATWRRAWRKYDGTLSTWSPITGMRPFEEFHCATARFCAMWSHLLSGIKSGAITTWDYQWVYAVMLNRGRAAVPSANLVTNIGFGSDSTHSAGSPPRWMARTGATSVYPLVHPHTTELNLQLDIIIGEEVFGLTRWAEFKHRIKQVLLHLGLLRPTGRATS